MKIRQNTTRFDSECVKFPALKEIDSFTPGLEAIILNIANTINKTGRKIDVDDILKKVLANGRKVKKHFFHFHDSKFVMPFIILIGLRKFV